jgi:hypothetical protein
VEFLVERGALVLEEISQLPREIVVGVLQFFKTSEEVFEECQLQDGQLFQFEVVEVV